MTTPLHNGRPDHGKESIDFAPMPAMLFVYRCQVDRVIDGDTLDVVIDQGMHARRIERVRLLGINTPEMKGASRDAGVEAKGFVLDWLAVRMLKDGWPFVIQTEKGDAFGRYLAHVWCAKSGEYLNKAIIDAGHAVPYKEK